MTNQHPITPSPELVREWTQNRGYSCADELWDYLAAQAAQWGADQELQACINFVYDNMLCDSNFYKNLRDARRPKPPSLKEQALDAWDRLKNEAWCEEIDFDLDFVRRALEALPND